MERRARAETKDQPTPQPAWPAALDAGTAASAVQDSMQRVLQWMQQTQTSQMAAMNACSKAMQAAMDGAVHAKEPAEMLAVQNGLFATVMAEASRCQNDAMSAWLGLLSGFAPQLPAKASEAAPRPLASAIPDGPWSMPGWPGAEAFEQAKASFNESVRQWSSFWGTQNARSR
jgi:hypothetical protein